MEKQIENNADDKEVKGTFGTPTKLSDDFLQLPQLETATLDEGDKADLEAQLGGLQQENKVLKSQLTTMESQLVEEIDKQAEAVELAEGDKADLKSENESLQEGKLNTIESQLMEEGNTQAEVALQETTMVRYIGNMEEWKALMETSKSKAVIIDFTASWCPPCKMIAPIFEKLAEETPQVEFVKVDVDDANDVAAFCGIQTMPTFQIFKDGSKVGEIGGANPGGLNVLVSKHK